MNTLLLIAVLGFLAFVVWKYVSPTNPTDDSSTPTSGGGGGNTTVPKDIKK
jgi:hypothetical protein